MPTEQKVAVVEAADKTARSVDQEQIKQVMVGYGDMVQKVTIANSSGDYVEDERIRTRLVVQAVAAVSYTHLTLPTNREV